LSKENAYPPNIHHVQITIRPSSSLGCDFFVPIADLLIHGRTVRNKLFKLCLMCFLFVYGVFVSHNVLSDRHTNVRISFTDIRQMLNIINSKVDPPSSLHQRPTMDELQPWRPCGGGGNGGGSGRNFGVKGRCYDHLCLWPSPPPSCCRRHFCRHHHSRSCSRIRRRHFFCCRFS